jgi:hypothetical protein
MAADSVAGVIAAFPGGGSAVPRYGSDPGNGRVPVPRHDRISSPEADTGLLAVGARPSADGVDPPAGIDRAGTVVGFAERCGIGVPGDARPHLAPHDRHPQLIANHSAHSTCGAGSLLRAGSRLGTSSRLGAGSQLSTGRLSTGS